VRIATSRNNEHHRQRDSANPRRATDVNGVQRRWPPSVPALLERGHEVIDPSLRDGRGAEEARPSPLTPYSTSGRTVDAISTIRVSRWAVRADQLCTATTGGATAQQCRRPRTASRLRSIVCRSSRLRWRQSRAPPQIHATWTRHRHHRFGEMSHCVSRRTPTATCPNIQSNGGHRQQSRPAPLALNCGLPRATDDSWGHGPTSLYAAPISSR